MEEGRIWRMPRWSLLELTLCACLILSQWSPVQAEGTKNETHSERYPLVVFDFERVELPYIICLWVLIASLAKIGECCSFFSLSIVVWIPYPPSGSAHDVSATFSLILLTAIRRNNKV